MIAGDPTVPLLFVAYTLALGFAFHMITRARKPVASVESVVALRDPSPISTNDEDEMEEQLSLIDAMEAKDRALDQVADNNVEWLQQALEAMKQIPDGTLGIAENFRFKLLNELGLEPPRTPNAWGKLTSQLIKDGVFVWTGRRLPMRGPKAHGRKSDEYVKKTPGLAA